MGMEDDRGGGEEIGQADSPVGDRRGVSRRYRQVLLAL